MKKRPQLEDWLQTESGRIAVESCSHTVDQIAAYAVLTEAQKEMVTELALESMRSAYHGGFMGGYDHASNVAAAAFDRAVQKRLEAAG